MALAEFNFGTLKYPWDDPRISDFRDNLDRVNAIAHRSGGFIWMLPEADMDAAQTDPNGPLADRPNTAATLSVWTDAPSLWSFVHKTLHSRFLERGAEWFKEDDRSHVVVWKCAMDHRPTIDEAMAHWTRLQSDGESETVFGAAGLSRLVEQRQTA